MKNRTYIFDAAAVSARKFTRSVWAVAWAVLRIILVSISLFVVLYLILSLVLSTDTEKRLRRENRAYEKLFSDIPARQEVLSRSIGVLEYKDGLIYNEVFHNAAPPIDPVGSLDLFFGADTIPDTKIVTYTTRKADMLLEAAAGVDAAFERIYRTLGTPGYVLPPMASPVKNVSYTQTGASVGKHFNPFYKAEVDHHGLDVIVPQGSPVYAPAAGTVSKVERSSKGDGNTITIEHAGGYSTRYLHLGELYVNQGQTVRKGSRIASIGMSGNSYAPHLHYEIRRYGKLCDPVGYLFGEISREEYPNMLYMSINTRQSMD